MLVKCKFIKVGKLYLNYKPIQKVSFNFFLNAVIHLSQDAPFFPPFCTFSGPILSSFYPLCTPLLQYAPFFCFCGSTLPHAACSTFPATFSPVLPNKNSFSQIVKISIIIEYILKHRMKQ